MPKTKYTKGKSGYYQTNVWDGTYTPNGKKHLVTLRSKKSSKDLERMVEEMHAKVNERQFVRKSNITFKDYAKAWKQAYKSHLEINTQNMYSNIINKHFEPLTCPVGDITRAHYAMAFNDIKGTRTKQQFQMVFKQVLRSAINDKLLPESAYKEIVSDEIKVKYESKPKRALTQEERKAITNCQFVNERDKVFLYLLYYTGMRGEEIRALTVFDINFKKKELTVNKAVAFDKEKPILKDTKNNVHRTIPISDNLVNVLEPYIKDLNGTKLFSMASGDYLTKSSYTKLWARVKKEMQKHCTESIEDLTPHMFRHNYCTSLCYKIPEISIKMIAQLLGDSEEMVIKVYNHISEERERPHEVVAKALII